MNSGIPDSGQMFSHPPSNFPCQTTQECAKVEKKLNSGILESGRMGSDSRRMICHPPSKCLCETTQESVNSGKFFNSRILEVGIPDSGWMSSGCRWRFFSPAIQLSVSNYPRFRKNMKIFEFRNSGFRADEFRMRICLFVITGW